MVAKRLSLFLIISLLLHAAILASFPKHEYAPKTSFIEIRLQQIKKSESVPAKNTPKPPLPEPAIEEKKDKFVEETKAPENKAETPPQPNPYAALSQMYGRMARMNFLMRQSKSYQVAARSQVMSLILPGFGPEDRSRFDGMSCLLMMNSEGVPEIRCGNLELEKRLSGLDWRSVPAPRAFSLPYDSLEIDIAFQTSEIGIGIKPIDTAR